MAAKPYWWMSRPHRKLNRVPKSLSAFAEVAVGQRWTGNRDLQIAFEQRIEGIDIKRQGKHLERASGRGGSGGRTHAALLYSLGLFLFHHQDAESPEEVQLTSAGQGLIEKEDALPILRRQVLAYQFPSAFSISSRVDVDRRFCLRPFVALLKLLRDTRVNGYLTDREIAACVIGYMNSHSNRAVDDAVGRVLDFRLFGVSGLPGDFAETLKPPTSKIEFSADELIKSGKPLGDIANTAVQWLRYTGLAGVVPGHELGAEEKWVTSITPEMFDEIDSAIAEWDGKLLPMPESSSTKFEAAEAAKAFQRTYGVENDTTRDQITLGAISDRPEGERTASLVADALNHLYSTQAVTSPSADMVEKVVSHSGIDRSLVEETLLTLISSPRVGMSALLDRYERMCFAGTEGALEFEMATEMLMADVFGLSASRIGQTGAVAGIEIWAETWAGIIDTKAYPAYDLPRSHQLRVSSDRLPGYSGKIHGRQLEFFLYLAGGFADSIDEKLRYLIDRSGVPGAAISIRTLKFLVDQYPGALGHHDLQVLWSVGREITIQDVMNMTSGQPIPPALSQSTAAPSAPARATRARRRRR